MADNEYLRGQLVEEETVITLDELCRHCMVESDEVVTLVREGVLDPVDDSLNWLRTGHWQFHISSVRRVRIAVRLQRDRVVRADESDRHRVASDAVADGLQG